MSKGRNVRGVFTSSERRAGRGDEGGENDAFLEVPDVTDFARGCGHVFIAAGSGTAMAGAEGVALVTGCVLTMAVVCVMVMLILLNGTQATVTIRLRTKDQSPRKLSEFLTARPPLPTSSSSFLPPTL